ncbi:WD40-repeat-containing domain protein [Ganoderma leucocontextum]|nr:WD40-repeat-containing domain protein [Ganoderma leucocontextum]
MPRRYKESVRLVNGHTDGITTASFSPKGNLLATGGMDGRVCFWRVQDGELLYSHEGDCPVLSMVWLPMAEYALMCGTKHGNIITVTITHALDDFALNGFWAHNYPIECLASSADRVASGAHGELKVWKWSAAAELPEPPTTLYNDHHEVLVTSLHWTPSDSHASLLMVTYMFHGVYLFETTRWNRVRSIPLPGKIASASLSEDGKYIAISNVDRGFDVFVMASEEPLRSFEHEVGEPRAVPVLFIHGGQAIVGGSVVGKVDVWDIFLGKMPPLPIPGTFHCSAAGFGRSSSQIASTFQGTCSRRE